jgi:hypothetical protein
VIAYTEVPLDLSIEPVAMLRAADVFDEAATPGVSQHGTNSPTLVQQAAA